jgi:hypothetical protein
MSDNVKNKHSNDMKAKTYKLFTEVQEGTKTPEQAQSELLCLLDVSESSFIAKIDDTTAFGVPHHNHSKHRVYVDGLTYEQAKKIQCFLHFVIVWF